MEKAANRVEYYVFPDRSLIVERFVGDVTLDLIKKASLAIWSDPNYGVDTKGFVDLRNASFKLSMKDLAGVVSFFFSNRKATRAFLVVLTDSSQNTALAFLLNSKLSGLMNLNVVSSEESALRHLGIHKSVLDIYDGDLMHIVS